MLRKELHTLAGYQPALSRTVKSNENVTFDVHFEFVLKCPFDFLGIHSNTRKLRLCCKPPAGVPTKLQIVYRTPLTINEMVDPGLFLWK